MRRRDFIKNAGIGAAGLTITSSNVLLNSCHEKRRVKDKIILALIGSGKRGIEISTGMCRTDPNVSIKYVCDVNDLKAAKGINAIKGIYDNSPMQVSDMQEVFNDKDVDGVIIATPEHWHALATVDACKARKDVYVEANPSHAIWENNRMIEAAKRYNRIIQVGFQRRSESSASSACEYIQNGDLGKVVLAKVYNMISWRNWSPSPDSTVPEGLDWDMWLGPAPGRPYNSGITDLQDRGSWDAYWAYSGGSLSVETSHLLDLARMVLGDPGHPKSVYCCGGNRINNSQREVPEIQAITYDYGEFIMTCENLNSTESMKIFSPELVVKEDENYFNDWLHIPKRIEIYGTKGLMYVNGEGYGWQVIGPDNKVIAQGDGDNPDNLHFKNFITCMRTGDDPAADIHQGRMSASLVHLGNIAYRMGNKKLLFDPEREMFIDNHDADKFLKPSYRAGFELPDRI